ncbi:hypothetical protein [Pseudomonas ficuserectae]|uniref:hypothetical protein n=1 Tax=Pseudomonas ficuserectae TaxID=53410 RepID=UPI00211C9A9A|nr:hypothetical protein [Pseudomonas ficuserectae]
MMIEGRTGKFGKFRFWFDEPHAAFFGKGVGNTGCSFLNGSSSYARRNSMILEVMIPKGARCLYGLLGVSYNPSSDVSIRAGNVIQSVTQEIYDDSLVGDFDVVKVGLPSEYMRASFSGLKRGALSDLQLDVQFVEICYGAYGAVSSSELIFERIGASLAGLLSLKGDGFTEDSVRFFLALD